MVGSFVLLDNNLGGAPPHPVIVARRMILGSQYIPTISLLQGRGSS